MGKKGIRFGSVGLALALIATLVIMLMPAKVDISQSGFLSVSSNVVLAVGEEPREAGVHETSWGYEYVLTGGDSIEVGNKDTSDFKPKVKLNRWDGECFIEVGLPTTEKFSSVAEENKVKFRGKDIEVHLHSLEPRTVIAKGKDGNDVEFSQCELGGFDFEVILKRKPASNEIVLDIETQGLRFYYQPALTQEEIAEGCVRPDNVVGSYAVYHATKRDHIIDQTNYMCGKAFHIYRPKITDAGGSWVWGELSIDEQAGTLTTTIPQDFLDKALYPISTGTSNFGYETKGGASTSYYNFVVGVVFTCPEGGTALSITAYYTQYSSNTPKIAHAIYKESDNSLVGYTEEWTLTGGWDGEKTLDIVSGGTLENIDYILCFWNGPSPEHVYHYYDSGGAWHRDAEAYNYPSWPEPFSRDLSIDRINTIYCTYEVAGGTAALTGTVTAATEEDIVTGSKTIILTLTGDTWVTAGGTFDAQRQNIIDGIDSAQSEATGWDAVVKVGQGVVGVVRTNDTVVTITLDAFATYDITAAETITATIPGSALTGGSPLVATPTFQVTAVEADISNLPTSKDFGVVEESATYDTGIAYFAVTNNSGDPVDITIHGTDMTGGDTWTLSDTCTPGTNIVGFKSGRPYSEGTLGFSSDTSLLLVGFANDTSLLYTLMEGEGYTIIVKKNTPYNTLILGLPDGASQSWGMRLYVPTETTDGAEKTGTITLSATLS